jgi:hypothetical protein
MIETTKARAVLLEPLHSNTDISSLKRFGKVVTMFGTRPVQDSPSVQDIESFTFAIERWLDDNQYDPGHDLFVVSGRLTKVAVALATIARRYYNQPFRVLVFDGYAQEYQERVMI